MGTTIAPAAAVAGYTSGRRTVEDSTGRLWTLVDDATDNRIELWYSDDSGSTWTENTAARITDEHSTSRQPSLCVLSDDSLACVYVNSSGPVNLYVMTAPTTSSTWNRSTTGIDTTVEEIYGIVGWVQSSKRYYAFAYRRSAPGSAYQLRVYDLAGGTFTEAHSSELLADDASVKGWADLDFHHTGDTTTVAGASPHLYVAWQTSTYGNIYFRRYAYSASTWTGGTRRTLASDGHTSVSGVSLAFDGTRAVVAHIDSSGDVAVLERDAGDTTTTDRTTVPAITGNASAVSVTFDGDSDIWLVAEDGSADVVQVEYDRSGDSWGTWTAINTGTVVAGHVRAKRGARSAQIDVTWVEDLATDELQHGSVSSNTAPTAPGWNLTDSQAHDVAETLTLDWTFTDPDEGDTQTAYALSRQIGAGTVEYYNAGSTSWGASETKNTSGSSSVVLAASWGADTDANHVYKVKTWDASDAEGVYGSGLTVVPSGQDNPTLTAPADAGTITTSTVTATWTVTTQTAYRARLLNSSGGQLETSGWVTSSGTSHTFERVLDDATDYQVEIATRNDEGLQSDTDTHTFTADLVEPGRPDVTLSTGTVGAVDVTVIAPAAVGSEPSVQSMEVRRRIVGSSGDGDRIAVGLASGDTLTDWTVASGVDYEWAAVTVGTNGTEKVGPWRTTADLLIASASGAWRASSTGALSMVDVTGNGHDATLGDGSTASTMPLLLDYDGTRYRYFTNSGTDYDQVRGLEVSTPYDVTFTYLDGTESAATAFTSTAAGRLNLVGTNAALSGKKVVSYVIEPSGGGDRVTGFDYSDTSTDLAEPWESATTPEGNALVLFRPTTGLKGEVVDRPLLLFAVDDYVDVPYDLELTPKLDDFTVVVALRKRDSDASYSFARYVSKGDAGSGANGLELLRHGGGVYDDGTGYALVDDGTTGASAISVSANAPGTAETFVAVLDRTADTVELFHNGTSQQSSSIASVGTINNTDGWRFGAKSGATPANFGDFALSGVAIFRGVTLTAAQAVQAADELAE